MSWQEIETQARASLANIQDISRLRSLEAQGKLPAGFADTAAESATAYVLRIVHLSVTSHGQRQPTVFIDGVKQR